MMMASNLKLPPNQAQILILGWPKTGSSSIFQWLADHPQVCGSSIEESFLFIDQNNGNGVETQVTELEMYAAIDNTDLIKSLV